MRSSRQGAIPSDLGDLIDELDDVQRRLRILEAPSGESLGNTVAKLSALVADIQAELDAYLAGRYTNSQIDAKDAAVQNNIIPTISGAGSLTINGVLYNPPAYNFDITYTRRTAWLGNDGRLGYASSSRDKKIGIEPADETRLARLLDIVPQSFYYRADIARRTRLRINEGIDYTPEREVGLIAEDLHDAGLHEFVIYDETGKPEGIEYGMLTVALLAVERAQRAEIAELRAGMAELRAHVGLGSEA
jgi:hypothetical protein